MKRISILYDFLKELGGLERVMFFQANALKKKYSPELIFSYISDKEKPKIVKELGLHKVIPIHQLGKSKSEIAQLLLSFLFPGRIKNLKTNLIISHSFMSSRLAFAKMKSNKTPYIVMIHHPPNFLYSRSIKWVNNLPRFLAYIAGILLNPLLKQLDIKAVRNSNLIISNSKYTSTRIKEIYNKDSIIIYPSLSNDFKIIKNPNSIIKKFGIKNKFIFLHGRMIKDKRPDLAVIAFSKIKKDKLDLVISGTIEEENKIKSLINTLNLQEKVKILGRVSNEELVALYNSASCFLMTAPKEDFGLTPIEAMACGCPVVAWADNAGPQETVIPNFNGRLAKPYDTLDFSQNIEKAIENNWNKKTISNSVKKFSQDSITKSLIEEVKKIIHSH